MAGVDTEFLYFESIVQTKVALESRPALWQIMYSLPTSLFSELSESTQSILDLSDIQLEEVQR